MNVFLQDVKYGIRMLLKNPGFSLVAVLTLALGIGANTAMFSVIDAVLLKALPYRTPNQLVMVINRDLKNESEFPALSYLDFADLKRQNQVFSDAGVYHGESLAFAHGGRAEQIQGGVVSGDLLPLLGIPPQLGTSRLPDETPGKGAALQVVLSHELWRSAFAMDPQVLGKTISLDAKSYTVAGVMPAGFAFPLQGLPEGQAAEFWISLAHDAENTSGSPGPLSARGDHYLHAIARLKPGVTLEQARANIQAIGSALQKQYPDSDTNFQFDVAPALQYLAESSRAALLILFGSVSLLLLLACANIANLLLARATTRSREIAIRVAIGATRGRILRQFLTESVLLSLAGGILGLAVADWCSALLIRLSPAGIPRIEQAGLNAPVLLFTFLVSAGVGVLFGLFPALFAVRSNVSEPLKESGRAAGGTRSQGRARGALVIAQIALATILVVSAGLLITSVEHLWAVKPGFQPAQVMTLNLSLPDAHYSEPAQAQFYADLLPRLRVQPGIAAASAIFCLPLSRTLMTTTFEIEGRPMAQSELPVTDAAIVEPGYFRTMGIPVLSGNDFSGQENVHSPKVIIINQSLAQRIFPHENPLGKRIKPGISSSAEGQTSPWREIIGVVGDVHDLQLSEAPTKQVYLPQNQVPNEAMTLVVRADGDPRSIIGAVKSQVAALDKDLPVFSIHPMKFYVQNATARPRFAAVLLGVFAGLALLLSAVGLFGVMAYTVAQRTHEIGIRMALGAAPGEIRKLVLSQGALLGLSGITIGLAGAVAASRLLATLVFGISTMDPATFIGVPLLIAAVALLACYVPTRRAMRVDPMVALRYE